MLNNVLERLNVGGQEIELANFEFNDLLHPHGFEFQTSFHQQIDPDVSNVSFVYKVQDVTFIRSLWLFGDHNVALIYWLAVDNGGGGRALRFAVYPLLTMRDFHSLHRCWTIYTKDAWDR